MNSLLGQLERWRFRERVVRLAWGGSRWLAIVGAVLAFACFADWTVDRYSGSQTWRNVLQSSWLFAGGDPLWVGETPFWFRAACTFGQVVLALVLGYTLIVRPWLRTPIVDALASEAEQAYPAFDHRLVTALQLNRATARTMGMSKILIAAVTREASELAKQYDLLKLIDYRRLAWSAAVATPIALAWVSFALANPALARILVERQALADVEIPRRTHLRDVTQGVWPSGAEVIVRFEVEGNRDPSALGVLRIVPEGQPEEFYDLIYEPWFGLSERALSELRTGRVPEAVLTKLLPLKDRDFPEDEFAKQLGKLISADEAKSYQEAILKVASTDSWHFATKLPASSRDFSYRARLGDGRTKEAGSVRFEAPPQLAPDDQNNPPLTTIEVLPTFLGVAPDGNPYTRRNESSKRGDIVDALPLSRAIVEARFNKPVSRARLILIESGEGIRERDAGEIAPEPSSISEDRKSAAWFFPTSPRLIGYRLELLDDRSFANPLPIRRNVRMWADRPPIVEFLKESTRNPDKDVPDGMGPPNDYVWDMALSQKGRVLVIYKARSDLGIREANIRYRVIPKGVQLDAYPEWYKMRHHPREDPDFRVFFRQELIRVPETVAAKLGGFVPDLGLFRNSYRGVPPDDQDRIDVGFYPLPSTDPATRPGELEAGGRRNFEVSDLRKMMPDGTFAKLEVGDTVELYVEVYDKLPGPDGKPAANRPAGYTREAKRKIVMTEADVFAALSQRDEERQKRTDKLRELAQDQISVFKEKKK